MLVHLGDGHEADSASRWPSEYDWDLKHEFAAHNGLLARLRTAAPHARRIILPGNHDANLAEINRIDKRLRSLCNPADHEPELAAWESPARYEYSRLRGVWRLGLVTFAHGYESGQSSDEMQSILLGQPYGLFVSGHTHRPTPGQPRQAKRAAAVPLPYWHLNTGAMRLLDAPYIARKRHHQWGQALVRGWAIPVKSGRDSRRSWDAECVLFRWYDDGDSVMRN